MCQKLGNLSTSSDYNFNSKTKCIRKLMLCTLQNLIPSFFHSFQLFSEAELF